MLLKEITYSLLELIREGSIVDDERLDIRLLETLVKSRRVEYIKGLADSNKSIPEDFYQYFNIDILSKVVQENGSQVYQTVKTPKIAFSRYGPLISEVTHLNNPLHSPYKIVNNHHFKFTGHGRFNRGLTYITYRDGKLFLKSNDGYLAYLDNIGVKAVLENPEEITGFNPDTGDYPLTFDAYEYIKKMILSEDIAAFVSGKTDENSDSSGEIKQ